MDDDVLPDDNCLEELIKYSNNNIVLVPLRITPKSEIFYNECKYFNFTNPFKSLWEEIIKYEDLNDDIIQIEGATFEGMFVPINIISKVGFPNKFYFIFADDTDYCIRLLKNNYKIYLVKSAIMNRQLNLIENTYFFKDWKAYYIIRNIFLLDRLYGNIFVKNLRPLLYFFKFLLKVKRLEDLKILNKAFLDAYFYKF
jgi:GT2 family glycosyltransferase